MASLQEFLVNCILTVVILIASRFLWNYLRSPLKSFPGPWQASFTNIWRFLETWQGRCELTHLDLHRKLGSAVRIGPNILSLSDPQLINQVYTARNPWMKSDQYNVNDVVIDGVRVKNLFSHQDEKWHSQFLRPIKGLYSMTRVQDNEAGVDLMITSFVEKIRERFIKTGKLCDMADYITYLAWDVMAQVTFSKDLGILEAGYDVPKIIETSSKALDYFAPVCSLISSCDFNYSQCFPQGLPNPQARYALRQKPHLPRWTTRVQLGHLLRHRTVPKAISRRRVTRRPRPRLHGQVHRAQEQIPRHRG